MSETRKSLAARLRELTLSPSMTLLADLTEEVDALEELEARLESALKELESGSVAVTGAGAAGFIRRRMLRSQR